MVLERENAHAKKVWLVNIARINPTQLTTMKPPLQESIEKGDIVIKAVTNMEQPTKEGIKERFDKTIFGKGGGWCFECCDYEAMYDDLLVFTEKEISLALLEKAEKMDKSIRQDIKNYVHMDQPHMNDFERGYFEAATDALIVVRDIISKGK